MTPTKIYISASYDANRALLRVKAQSGFGGDVYTATVEDVDHAEAVSQVRAFASIYGVDEVEVDGGIARL